MLIVVYLSKFAFTLQKADLSLYHLYIAKTSPCVQVAKLREGVRQTKRRAVPTRASSPSQAESKRGTSVCARGERVVDCGGLRTGSYIDRSNRAA